MATPQVGVALSTLRYVVI